MVNIPQDIINQYILRAKAVNGKVLLKIRKGMCGLKQAGQIANNWLKHHLKASGYVPFKYTPGIFTHVSRKISQTRPTPNIYSPASNNCTNVQ